MTESDRISRLEGIAETTTERLGEMNANMNALNNTMNSRFNSIEGRFNSIEGRITTQFLALVGMWATTMIAVLSVLVTILLRLD